ncbi:MAG TPA: ABC transporter ATP-binding protein [Blastocatellia bacterium]|nr:ABC transporter ATP-binding protein [Blastocatellia bacterium]
MLLVRDIRFSYAEPVLKGLSFEVGAGEMLAVLGPNGSGKSTLLKTVVGILAPSSGSVVVDGRNLTKTPRREAARLVGYVAQESAVRFPLTALEFVLQGRFAQGRLVGFESDEDVREAARAMELTQTAAFESRVVSELSGGERQRVMLARALASRPRLLVLDEPVANLDISHQVKMLDLVSRAIADEGISAVVVTHELNLAAEFATAVLLLKSGEMAAFGEPAEVLSEGRLRDVFDTDVIVDVNPLSGAPRITLVRPSVQARL